MTYGTAADLAVGYVGSTETNRLRMYIDELQPGRLQLLNEPGYLYAVSPRGFRPSRRWLTSSLSASPRLRFWKGEVVANVLGELKRSGVDLVEYDNVLEAIKKRPPGPRNMLE